VTCEAVREGADNDAPDPLEPSLSHDASPPSVGT
jgi:hypothetical protein